MATEEDILKTEQNAIVRLARGTKELINVSGATVAASGVKTHPTDPIDTTNHKRIVGRLTHDSTLTAGKFTFEFSNTENFATITFNQTVDLNITTNPIQKLVGASVAADQSIYCADMDVESMDRYFRCKMRNDTVTTVTYGLNVRAKVS